MPGIAVSIPRPERPKRQPQRPKRPASHLIRLSICPGKYTIPPIHHSIRQKKEITCLIKFSICLKKDIFCLKKHIICLKKDITFQKKDIFQPPIR